MNLPETIHPQQILYVSALHRWHVSIRVQCKLNFCKSDPVLEGHLMPSQNAVSSFLPGDGL